MLAVLAIWIILSSIFLCLGDIFFLITKKESSSISSTFFIGLAISSILACSLSIFIPLTSILFIIIVGATILYWILLHKRLKQIFDQGIKSWKELSIWGKFFFLFIAFVVLYHSSSFSSSFDQFLYHQQHIKWLQEYGIVKGLANLHIRFGFNSSSLSIISLFAYHPELKISFTALNGLSLFVFASWLTLKIFRGKSIVSLICTITLVIFAHFYAMELSSSSTDIIVNILVAYLLLSCLLNKSNKKSLLVLAILPVFCVTLKLAAAPIVILSFYTYFQFIKSKDYKSLTISLLIAGLISIPWLIQNILLTGYLIFPFAGLDIFSFDWKVPLNIVSAEQITTYNWARGISGDGSFSLSWIPQWWLKLPPMDQIIYLLAPIAILASVLQFKRTSRQNSSFVFGYITAIVGTLFGLFTAPALRFSLGFTLLTILFTICILFIDKKGTIINRAILVIQYVFIGVFVIFHIQYIGSKTKENAALGGAYLRAQFVKPFPLHYAANNTEFDSIRINNIEIFIPKNGSCVDHQLPCTPGVNSNLELRGQSIKEGFRIKQ